jgi:hypothetical protein
MEARTGMGITDFGRIEEKLFNVGDYVEVLCDHNRDDERVRDWLPGTVVQADRKMVAVQFLQDVYLTGGWMVPDRVLWLQQKSSNIRPSKRRRKRRKQSRSRDPKE